MASQRSADVLSHLSAPAYGVGLLFVVLPIVDVLAQVWPPSVGSPSWRYGLVGLGANYVISALFGLLLICVTAAFDRRRRTLRWLGIASAVFAVLAVLAAIGFALDVLQLRPGVPRNNPLALRMFDTGAAKAVFKYLVTAVAFAWVGLGAFRAARGIPAPAEADAPKLVGQQS